MEEAGHSGIHTNRTDLLHGSLTRDISIQIDANDPNQLTGVRMPIAVRSFFGMMPDHAGICSCFDLHIVHPAPDVFFITGICNIHTAVKIHDSDLLSSHYAASFYCT